MSTSKALLVGINDYAPVGAGGPDLHGCVNDVKDMANTLGALEIVPISPILMRILTDDNATRANILSGLKWLLAGTTRGDHRIFYYSGHGTYRVDLSGDEIDKRDEAICPHDFASAGPILDDDICRALSEAGDGVNLEVIFDSCFSGTSTRLMLEGSSPETLHEFTPRFVGPPAAHSIYADAQPGLPVRGILKAGRSGRELAINHVLWSGCRDNETSGEGSVGGMVRGYFTYAFCKCLRGAGINVTRERLASLVSLYLSRMGVTQHPLPEGTRGSWTEKVFT